MYGIYFKHIFWWQCPETRNKPQGKKKKKERNEGKIPKHCLKTKQYATRKPMGQWWMATHSSILVWKIHGQKSIVCYSPWGYKWLNTIEHAQWWNQRGNLKIARDKWEWKQNLIKSMWCSKTSPYREILSNTRYPQKTNKQKTSNKQPNLPPKKLKNKQNLKSEKQRK